jgi:bleomycin hydrolase
LYPESAHSGNSRHLNWLVTAKLREFAYKIRQMSSKSKDELQLFKKDCIKEIHRILVITLGEPPTKFTWNFRNKDKKFHSFPDLTPQSFFKDHVQYPIADTVSLVNDPRNDYQRLLTVKFLGNIVGGKPVRYVNVPIETLKLYAINTIKAGKPVWFGCDVGKFLERKLGIMDLKLFDYDLAFNVKFTLSKADRLSFGESLMTHAMVFSGVHLENGKPVRWRVE